MNLENLQSLPLETIVTTESVMPLAPNHGDLLVWHHYQIGDHSFTVHYPVKTSDEAMEVIDLLDSKIIIFPYDNVSFNCFGLLMFDVMSTKHNAWEEWSICGNDIITLMEKRKKS